METKASLSYSAGAKTILVARVRDSLTCLFGAYQGDDPAELGALLELGPLDVLVRVAGRNILPRHEHAVLQSQHLGEQVVQERCRELDAVCIRIG